MCCKMTVVCCLAGFTVVFTFVESAMFAVLKVLVSTMTCWLICANVIFSFDEIIGKIITLFLTGSEFEKRQGCLALYTMT